MWNPFHRRRNIPRRFAVYASADGDSDDVDISVLMARCPRLRAEATADNVELDESVASLTDVERLLYRRREQPVIGLLRVESAAYVGTVLAKTLDGAQWHLNVDRHPVLVIPGVGEVSVIDEVLDHTGETPLTAVHASIMARARQARARPGQ